MEQFERFFEEDTIANEFIASNFTNNYSRILDLDNLSLGISSIGIRRMVHNLREYMKLIDKSKESKTSENIVVFAPACIEFINKNKSIMDKFYKIISAPGSCKLSTEQIETEVKTAVEMIRKSYEYLSEESHLKSKATRSKSDIVTYAKLIIRMATDIHVDPQKTIYGGYMALNNARIKHNKAQAEDTREELNKAEEAFELWQKAKSFAYHLMNNDISLCYGICVKAYNKHFK